MVEKKNFLVKFQCIKKCLFCIVANKVKQCAKLKLFPCFSIFIYRYILYSYIARCVIFFSNFSYILYTFWRLITSNSQNICTTQWNISKVDFRRISMECFEFLFCIILTSVISIELLKNMLRKLTKGNLRQYIH